MTIPAAEPGRIITFYSYKGGTGRSMALANVAWILASNGHRVLAVDWDLEAPGLHRYFAPFMLDPELTDSEGVLDLVHDYVTAAMTPMESPATAADPPAGPWYEPYANVLRYTSSLEWTFPEFEGRKGWIDLLPAGKQGLSYGTRMNSFSWQNFYDRLGGGGFVESMKQRMRQEYDYILIDSRTGVSDTSGICTVQLPDILVVCFTLNRQSIEGASAVASYVSTQRADLRILPVPTRVEKAEKQKMDVAMEAAKDAFAPFVADLGPEEEKAYWGQVQVFYEPFYAYEEILATFRDEPLQTSSLLASMERITGRLTGKTTQLVPAEETDRQRVLAKYTRQSRSKTARSAQAQSAREYVFYVSYARMDLDELLERFLDDLNKEVRTLTGTREAVGFVDLDLTAADHWAAGLADALQRSKVLVPVFSPSYFNSSFTPKEFAYFRQRNGASSESSIAPVQWVQSPLPAAVAEIQVNSAEFPETYRQVGLRMLMRLRRYADDYQLFLAAFAGRVVAMAQSSPPLSDSPAPSFDDLPFSFMEPSDANETQPVLDSLPASEERLRQFTQAIPRFDRQEIIDFCDTEVVIHLRRRSDPYPLADAKKLLQNLARRRMYDLMERVANEMIQGGQEAPEIRLLHAQSLIRQDKTSAALAIVKTFSSEAGTFDRSEVKVLLGEAYKRLYVEADTPALPRNQQNLALAIRAYEEVHKESPQRLWYGSNAMALVARSIRDNVRVASIIAPAKYVETTAHALLDTLRTRIAEGEATIGDYAVGAEASLALGQDEEAVRWVASFVQEPEVGAFEIAGLLRQLSDVWQLRSSFGVGQTILPVLQAELLRRDGGGVTV